MTTSYDFILGFDISKLTLDTAICDQGKVQSQEVIMNEKDAIKHWLHTHGIDLGKVLICAEQTGLYGAPLIESALELGIDLWLVNPVHLKRSMGLQRGKNDKVDAERIAKFAYRFQDEACIYTPPVEQVKKLKELTIMRSRLLKSIHQFRTPINEMKAMNVDINTTVKNCSKSILATLEKEFAKIEVAIKEVIESTEEGRTMLKQLISVPGIGKVVAPAILLHTEMFTKFTDSRKFACYAGIAPFEHSSGTSVRGKTKVSPMANKDMKKLLHLAAMAAVSGNNQYKIYYEARAEDKKTGRPGKNKMSVLNAVRNKIVHTAFALIQNGTMYQENYQHSFG